MRNLVALIIEFDNGTSIEIPVSEFKLSKVDQQSAILTVTEYNSAKRYIHLKNASFFDPVVLYALSHP